MSDKKRGNPLWVKGVSGNPNGRPKVVKDIQELARQHAPEAIEALVSNLGDENGSVRNAAAMALLDRGYGKPAQTTNMNVTRDDVRRLSDDAIARGLAEIRSALSRGAEAEEHSQVTH